MYLTTAFACMGRTINHLTNTWTHLLIGLIQPLLIAQTSQNMSQFNLKIQNKSKCSFISLYIYIYVYIYIKNKVSISKYSLSVLLLSQEALHLVYIFLLSSLLFENHLQTPPNRKKWVFENKIIINSCRKFLEVFPNKNIYVSKEDLYTDILLSVLVQNQAET